MKKGLAILTLIVLVFGIGEVNAENLVIEFSADSLIWNGGTYHFSYPGTGKININRHLSIPCKTIYIENYLSDKEIKSEVKPEDKVMLGVIPDSLASFENTITGLDPYEPARPSDYSVNINDCLFSCEKIKINGQTFSAVTILPLTLGENFELCFNKKIELNIPGGCGNVIESENFVSAVMENGPVSQPGNAAEFADPHSQPPGPELIIITSTDLFETFEELARFRNETGISTSVIDVDSIYARYSGEDQPEQIRNYLSDFYNLGGKYVLLGGDETIIPPRYLYYYNTSTPPSDPYVLMPSDLYYADLDGVWDADGDGIWGEPTHDEPDIVPELKVGRLPVRKPESAARYISKLIMYQTDPGFGDYEYLDKTLFFSSDQMRDYPAEGQHGYIAAELPEYITVDTSQTIEMPDGYDPEPTNPGGAYGVGKISEGFGLIHILAHGRTDGFRVKAANYGEAPTSLIVTAPPVSGHGSLYNLEANGKVSLYYSLSCQVGGYELDSDDWSFVERIIAAENSGGIGMVAYARWGWVYSSYLLEASFTNHLFGDADGSPIDAMYYSWLDYSYYRDLVYGQNYFGDPTLKIYQSIPVKTVIEIQCDESSCLIEITGNEIPIENAEVIVAVDGIPLLYGTTDADGQYILPQQLEYGTEYCISAVKACCTVGRLFYTPTFTLDIEDDEEPTVPDEFALGQNYPNPFNPATTIEYSLPQNSDVNFEIYNILGQMIYSQVSINQSAGRHSIVWQGNNNQGQQISSGVYIYRLTAGEFTDTKKMALMK